MLVPGSPPFLDPGQHNPVFEHEVDEWGGLIRGYTNAAAAARSIGSISDLAENGFVK